MSIAVAFEDAPSKMALIQGDGHLIQGSYGKCTLLDPGNDPDRPQAVFIRHTPGFSGGTHYHSEDQFQVVVSGEGRVGRNPLGPRSIHFSTAFTPYGPLTSDGPLDYFVLRARRDIGSQYFPANKDQLMRIPDRAPWQITCAASQSPSERMDTQLRVVPEMKDDFGMAAYALSMQAHAKARAPDPSQGDGQYLVVLEGSVLREDREYGRLSLVFVAAQEEPLRVQAGSFGLEALVLNFPRRRVPPEARTAARSKAVSRAT